MKKRKKRVPKGVPGWMVSYGDMNNLLMCLFIIMMGEDSVSTAEDFRMVSSSFRGNIGMMEGGSSFSKGALAEMGQTMMSLPSSTKGKALGNRMGKAAELFQPEIQSKAMRVTEDERGLIISLASDFFFDSGSAKLKPEMQPILTKVSNVIRTVPNFVRIEGHTDSSTIRQTQIREGFRTNWELSASRSLAVLLYMTNEESVNPKQLSAVAFGEHRPIDNNNTPEGRAYNRRVDIVILKERFLEDSKDPNISKPLPDEEWR